MFLLRLALVFLATSGTYSQDKLIADNQGKGYAFGKLRLSEDGKTEELISSPNTIIPSPNQDQTGGNSHPLPSPCVGARPATKLPYPNEKTKFILCRDEYHYEIFTCPHGGEWNEETSACNFVASILDKCEQEKPCLNDGQCLSLSNSTFKCTCRAEWTGDRCEIPLNSCSNKPCGPGADCRSLKTTKADQDYVCVCNGKRGYGLNCQEIVPNPCLKSTEQFYPFAFSAHAYIQCDGDLIHFQPCGSLLYWNQEEKVCDRKRPAKIEMPKLITKLTANKDDDEEEKKTEIVDREKIITAQKPIEQENTFGQKVSDSSSSFVSNQVETRPQLPINSQPILANKFRSDFVPQTQQWSSPEQLRGSSFGTQSPSSGSKNAQTQFGQSNEAQQQRFGGQQWSSARPIITTQSNEKNFAPVESWRTKSQFGQTQQVPTMNVAEGKLVDDQNRLNTNLQSNNQFERGQQNQFSNSPKWSSLTSDANTQEQGGSWQARPSNQFSTNQLPQTSNFNTQSTQTANAPREAWRRLDFRVGSSNGQNLIEKPIAESDMTRSNANRFQELQNSNTEEKTQSWQIKTPTSMTENQFPQKNDSFVMQTRGIEVPEQRWQRTESVSSFPGQSQNLRGQQTWEMRPSTQTTQNQFEPVRTIPEVQQSWRRAEAPPVLEQAQNSNSQSFGETLKTGSNTWTAQNLRGQQTSQPVQTWQRFDSRTNEQTSQNVNQPSFDQNSRLDSNTFVPQNVQSGKVEEQDWNNKVSTQQNPKVKSQSSFFFRPMFETERQPNQQENILSAQNPSNQVQTGTPVASSFEQKSNWVSNQQFPTQGGHHLTNTNDANMQTNRLVQPSVSQGSQNWQKPQTFTEDNQ